MVQTVTNQDTGLKILHEPKIEEGTLETQTPIFDFVAIHGIGAHPDHTWSQKVVTRDGERYVNWLADEDMLPSEIPSARIMRFGYMSQWFGGEAIRQRPGTIADGLLRALKRKRRQPALQSRPLVFVAHGFGGLVVLKALLEAEQFPDDWPGIYSAICGLLFLGTPFRGSPSFTLSEKIQTIDAESQETIQGSILKMFDPDDDSLAEIVDSFEKVEKRSSYRAMVTCFFEQKPCEIKSIAGKKGKKLIAVTESSGCLDTAQKVGLQRSHSDINKFGTPDEHEYRILCDVVIDIVDKIPYMVLARSQTQPLHCLTHREYLAYDGIGIKKHLALRSLVFPGMHHRRHDTGMAHKNTCSWITKHQSYIDWLEESSGILCIKGKPRSGKSTLMEFLLRDFKKQASAQESLQISFFLHGRGTSLQKSRLGMYRSLLHELLVGAPTAGAEFYNEFQQRSRTRGDFGKDWHWHVNELRAFFMSAVDYVTETKRVNVFVDAIDEATDETGDQHTSKQIVSDLKELNDLLYRKNLRSTICFSCRHFPVVSDNQAQEICIEKENQEDIAVYVRDELHRRLSLSESEQQHLTEMQDSIVNRAQGVFQWAAFAVDSLIRYHNDGLPPMEIKRLSEEVPKELVDVYEHILRKVIDKKYYPETLRLLRWVCFAQRPLTVKEIYFAMNTPETEILGLESALAEPDFQSYDVMARRIVSLSGGLIECRHYRKDQRVQFIHHSVNDFLIQNGLRLFVKTSGDPIGPGHHQLSLTCANYMRSAEMDFSTRQDVLSVKKKHPFVGYVVRHWFSHAEKAETQGVPQDYLLRYIQYCPSMLERWVKLYSALNYRYIFAQNPHESSTMLHVAAWANLSGLVTGLISTHHDLEQTNSIGHRAIHYACRRGHANAVTALLDAGVDFEAECERGNTPLQLAAAEGHKEIVRLLIVNGAEVNKSTRHDGTALYGAASKGSVQVVQLLLAYKAEVNVQGGEFGNALQAAAYEGNQAIVQLLLDNKAEVNAQGGEFGNALQAAAYRGHQAIVQLLLNNEAEVNSQGGDYGSALQAAAYEGNRAVVQLLLDNKAEVNSQGGYYGNALQAAADGGHQAIVQLLLDNNAEVNAQGGKYGNALKAARRNLSEELVQLLLENGAKEIQEGEHSNAL